MRLSPARFNGLLSARSGVGQALTWSRASVCPCRDPFSGAAKQGCPTCQGKGVFWGAAVDAWSGMASMRVAREWAAFGLWESGDVVLTIPSDSPFYAAGESDRAVMVNSSEPFSVVLTRGSADAAPATAISISQVLWLDPTAQTPVYGSIPALAPGGAMTWAPGVAAPPAGVQYTLQGRRQPEYYLFRDFPQDRAHQGGSTLPRRVILRRFDLFGR